MRQRPIKNIYFQFIQGTEFDKQLDAEQGAAALERAGLIYFETSGQPDLVSGYSETPKMHAIPEDKFHDAILEVFRQYIVDQGLE
jgi:hypothetical protein